MMLIRAINSLPNPASFPILCFNLKKKMKMKMKKMEKFNFLEYFFSSGVLHSVARGCRRPCKAFFSSRLPNTRGSTILYFWGKNFFSFLKRNPWLILTKLSKFLSYCLFDCKDIKTNLHFKFKLTRKARQRRPGKKRITRL